MNAKLALSIFVCCGLFAQGPSPQGLADVKLVFVDTLGPGQRPAIIRDQIIKRLSASGRFQVTLDPDKADAALIGSATETSTLHDTDGNVATRFDVTVVVRLVTKDQRVLWVSEAKNGPFYTQPTGTLSASLSAAENIVKDLLKAASPPNKKQSP